MCLRTFQRGLSKERRPPRTWAAPSQHLSKTKEESRAPASICCLTSWFAHQPNIQLDCQTTASDPEENLPENSVSMTLLSYYSPNPADQKLQTQFKKKGQTTQRESLLPSENPQARPPLTVFPPQRSKCPALTVKPTKL